MNVEQRVEKLERQIGGTGPATGRAWLRRAGVVGSCAIVVGTMLFIGWALFGPVVTDLAHRQKFDAEVWPHQESVEYGIRWPPRQYMVDDLMSSGKLDGLTESQVVQLLGPPQDQSFPFGARAADIHYYLGRERGFMAGIDSEWLFITFGDDGRVNRYWLYTD